MPRYVRVMYGLSQESAAAADLAGHGGAALRDLEETVQPPRGRPSARTGTGGAGARPLSGDLDVGGDVGGVGLGRRICNHEADSGSSGQNHGPAATR